MQTTETELTPVERLTRDLASGAVTLGRHEARFLVDEYYAMQEHRKRSNNQVLALSGSGEPHEIIRWFSTQSQTLENQVKRALAKYVGSQEQGAWPMSIRGIGPVITAGLLAHLSVKPWRCPRVDPSKKIHACKPGDPHDEKCGYENIETVGHWWRFAGLDPTSHWDKGERRPWNASLKTLCWKIGESFVKIKGHEAGFYGHVLDQNKDYLKKKNANGDYREAAEKVLRDRPKHKQAATYKQGILPDGHIHARAKRYAVKLFLAHLHDVWYRIEFDREPPLPYAIGILGHAHHIKPKGL